jgi:hypothetical protein
LKGGQKILLSIYTNKDGDGKTLFSSSIQLVSYNIEIRRICQSLDFFYGSYLELVYSSTKDFLTRKCQISLGDIDDLALLLEDFENLICPLIYHSQTLRGSEWLLNSEDGLNQLDRLSQADKFGQIGLHSVKRLAAAWLVGNPAFEAIRSEQLAQYNPLENVVHHKYIGEINALVSHLEKNIPRATWMPYDPTSYDHSHSIKK